MRPLVLASQSPRRKELLERAGFKPHTLSVEVSEILEKNLKLEDALMQLAWTKAQAALASGKLAKFQEYLLLTGDTVVVSRGRVLGKPKDEAEAVEFLSDLSGNAHSVMTAVCLVDENGRREMGCDETRVEFRKLSREEIVEYVKSGEPMDKAGAYAIQGLAKKFVSRVDGELDTVIGLPTKLVEKLIRQNGWQVERE